METNEKQLNETQSLEVIQQMLNKVKSGIEDDSFYYIFWGWLVFIAAISNFILMNMNVEWASAPWFLMILGGIVTFFYGMKQDKNRKVKTYADDFIKFPLISFGVSMVMVIGFSFKLGLNSYPMILLTYGSWLFISGGVIRFRPAMIGGIINWILAAASFFVDFRIQLLILAAAVLCGFIIPGHMLKSRFRKNIQASQA